MNKTVNLVNEWGNYEAKHPDATIEDFCRYYLTQQKEQKTKGPLVGGIIPNFNDGLLIKIIARIGKLNSYYANLALDGTGLNQMEEFSMLITIKHQKNPKKVEIINANLLELSSGTDMLNRIKKRGLIKEYNDKEDKRAKRIELTSQGNKVVELCMERIRKNSKLLLNDLTEDDKELCIQLLKNVEIKFSSLWQQHKNKSFDEVYSSIVPVPVNSNGKKKK
jgi:DNA-binding MarR family transcriptional regulator